MQRMKHTLALASAAIAIAACSEYGPQGDAMPESGLPLTVTATIAGGPITRATVDGTWEDGDEAALWVQDDAEGIYRYKVSEDGIMTGNYLWPNKNVPLNIQAVYPYRAVSEGGKNLKDISWSVEQAQNEGNGYENSDLLCSEQLNSIYGGYTPFMNFYHQTAKVVVNVEDNDFLQNLGSNPDMTIKGVVTQGTFNPPISSNDDGIWTGEWTPGSESKDITPHVAAPATGYAATFEALVIPQPLASGKELFTFTVAGGGGNYGPFRYTLEDNAEWKAGYEYVYDITITAGSTGTTKALATPRTPRSMTYWKTDGIYH